MEGLGTSVAVVFFVLVFVFLTTKDVIYELLPMLGDATYMPNRSISFKGPHKM